MRGTTNMVINAQAVREALQEWLDKRIVKEHAQDVLDFVPEQVYVESTPQWTITIKLAERVEVPSV